MPKKILIDSSLETETRIALTENDKLEEYEIESSTSSRIKSNVYLAQISRVEASLQAAFVDFGGNRHGFLSFTEIHPDYFKIPIADQKKLKDIISQNDDNVSEGNNTNEENSNNGDSNIIEGENDISEKTEETITKDQSYNKNKKIFNFLRKYKIQEVIKSRQVILVQINKEERGLKGAALTTYLSFAGRYCVLMPNSNTNIGISRKIQDQNERKKLKEILSSIGVPKGMSVIIRTAGIGKTKKDISKDLDFLVSQWNKIRELTLNSNAPSLIYEEGNIIKRTIRDLYSKDISSIIIDGKNGHNVAKKYMKELIPTQIIKLKLYKDKKERLFPKYGLEKQIDELYNSSIKLESGGSIVINSTEALVAIDVNSGKATQHRNIETTALNTNLEASKEIARQVKLRDLAGLIVIDYIDMEDHRNNFKVEKTLRSLMTTDRARIQIGRISPFGLMELSRQRLKTSITERSYEKCSLCSGTGITRNSNLVTEQLFKVLLEKCILNKKRTINIKCHTSLAKDILNKKRNNIIELEKNFGCNIIFDFNNSYILNEPSILVDNELKNEKNILHAKTKSRANNNKTIKTIKTIKTKKNLVRKLTRKTEAKKINKESKVSKDLQVDEIKNETTKKGWWDQSAN